MCLLILLLKEDFYLLQSISHECVRRFISVKDLNTLTNEKIFCHHGAGRSRAESESVCLTSAPPVSAVCVSSLQVEEAVGEVLVEVVFGLLDHLVLWQQTKRYTQTSRTLAVNTSVHKYSQIPVKQTHPFHIRWSVAPHHLCERNRGVMVGRGGKVFRAPNWPYAWVGNPAWWNDGWRLWRSDATCATHNS